MVLRASKPFQEVADKIRAGQADTGLAELASIRAPEPFKAMVRGEVAAFRLDWDATVEKSLTVIDAAWREQAWYSGNVLHDHLRLLTYAALRSGISADVLELVDRMPPRGDHTDRVLGTSATALRKAFEDDTPLEDRARRELPTPRGTGAGVSSLHRMLAKNRPRVPPDSVEGVSYLLHFAPSTVATDEVLALYESVASQLGLPQEHERMALLYLAVDDEVGAWRAVRRYVRAWMPYEWSQVEPVQLFGSYALAELITEQRGRVILHRELDPLVPPDVGPTQATPRSSSRGVRQAAGS